MISFLKKSSVVLRVIFFFTLAGSVFSGPEQREEPRDLRIPKLSENAKLRIGLKIWENESKRSIKGLTHWNSGEEFSSLGIGHFIWYPAGFQGIWKESFPRFIQYALKYGKRSEIPTWLLKNKDCPWASRSAFYHDFNSPRLVSLRKYLQNNISLQTDFIIHEAELSAQKILQVVPNSERNKIARNYKQVASSPRGVYALIDYVNFKGDGTKVSERYANKGWGLLWVLKEMKNTQAGKPALEEFCEAAKRCLDRRISNSPRERNEARWRTGWHKRCDTYATEDLNPLARTSAPQP